MPAEEIHLELLLERGHRKILDRTGLGVCAVVEQGIEPAAGALEHRRHQGSNGVRFAVVEVESLDAVAFKGGDVLRFSGCCKDPPAFRLECPGAICTYAGRGAGDDDGAQLLRRRTRGFV